MRPSGAHGGCTPHFLFETSKRKCAVHGGKEKMSGPKSFPAVRFGQTGGERAGASVNDSLLPGAPGSLGTESASPQLGAWVRLSGVLDERHVLLAPRVPLRYALPGGSGKADSRSAERQRRENAGQIGLASPDARWQSVAGGGPKVSARPNPRLTLTPIQPPGVSCWDPRIISK